MRIEVQVFPHDSQRKIIDALDAQIGNMQSSEQHVSQKPTTTVLDQSCEVCRTVPKKPHRETNQEILKLRQRFAQVHDGDLEKKIFWTSQRRGQLNQISSRVFTASAISGAVLFCLTILWFHHFTIVHNIYTVRHGRNGADESDNITITSPFVNDIKYAKSVLFEYALGTLLLLLGSGLAKMANHKPFKLRHVWYLCSIFILFVSIALSIEPPMKAFLASNSPSELKILENNEYEAYVKRYKGTVGFFQKGQCRNIEKFTLGKSQSIANRTKFFCEMLSRLAGFLYVSLLSAMIPFLALVFCLLEVIGNKKRWETLTIRHYKPRTPEQKANDRSCSGTNTVLGAIDIEKLY